MRGRLARLAVVPLCVAALAGVVAVSAAQANWTVNGSTLGSTSHQSVNLSSSGSFTLEGTIAGEPFKITATGVECATAISSCSIDGSSFGTNHSTDALKFTGVTVTPSPCELPGHVLTTTALTDQVIMSGANTYDKFTPASGTTFADLEFVPAGCPFFELTTVLKGTVTPKMEATGIEIASQPLTFSEANQTGGGGSLALGGLSVAFTGNALMHLPSGQRFSVSE